MGSSLFAALRRFFVASVGATCCVALLYFAVLPLSIAQAAPTDVDAQQQQNQILVQEEQRRKEALRSIRRLAPPGATESAASPEAEAAAKSAGACFTINTIVLDGAALLDAKTQRRLTKPFVGRCLRAYDLNQVLRVITNHYIGRGYVTTRAYIAAQDLRQGTLTINVVEGKAQRIRIRENGRDRPFSYAPFLNIDQQVLSIYDLEQGLDQINRLRSQQATLQISPGAAPGQSLVDVDVVRRAPVRLFGVLDNSGLPQTGRRMLNVGTSADDLLGLYETWSLNYKQDLEGRKRDLMNQTFTTDFSIPFGYWTLRTMTRELKYALTSAGFLRASGASRAYTTELERVVYRDGSGKLTLGGGLTAKQILAYQNELFIPGSSRHLTIGTMRLGYVRKLPRGVFDGSLSYNQGLGFLRALHDAPGLAKRQPHAQFRSVQTDLEYLLPFNMVQQSFSLDSLVHGQWAPHTLFTTEQISMGGQYTVRGFLAESLIANTGVYTRNEVVWHVPVSATHKSFIDQLDAFVGLDAGWIYPDTSNTIERGNLEGMAVGLRANNRYTISELLLERALHAPAALSHSNYVVRFKLGLLL